jgi:release factor glutamine methyltransferase
VAAGAPNWLAPGGALLIETSARQAPGTLAAFAAAGLRARVVRDEDLAGTVVVGRLP